MGRERARKRKPFLLHHSTRSGPLTSSREAGPAHVLVVEDSSLVSGAMRILFENAGHRVSVAASIAEALSIGSADPAALVLLDLTLPDGSGLALVEPLRAAGCRNVVALTGHDDPETRERSLAAGCADVLVKPVPARELVARSAFWLNA